MTAEQWAAARALAQWSRKLCYRKVLILFRGARPCLCAPFLFVIQMSFTPFKIYDESTVCVFVTTDSQDSSPTPSVTFSLGYCKQLRSQHQSLGA